MIKPKGLGRGLDALLGGGQANAAREDGVLREIAIGDLSPGKYQPRTRMDKEALEGLAQSIQSRGVVQPILVRALKAGKPDPSFERQVAHARKTIAAVRPEDEVPAGAGTGKPVAVGTVALEKVSGKTRVTYGVATGDTLWSISQRFDCSITDLKNWNEVLERGAKRMRVGTPLVIWPGPKAKLEAGTP